MIDRYVLIGAVLVILLSIFYVAGDIIKKKKLKRRVRERQEARPKPQAPYNGYCVYVIKKGKKAYVGSTGSFRRRKNQHFDPEYRAKHNKYLYHCWDEEFEMVPVFKGLTKQEALYIEARLIKAWATQKPYGYNIADEKDNRQLGYNLAITNRKLFDIVQEYATITMKHKVLSEGIIITKSMKNDITISNAIKEERHV